jgi:hypothetical protein
MCASGTKNWIPLKKKSNQFACSEGDELFWVPNLYILTAAKAEGSGLPLVNDFANVWLWLKSLNVLVRLVYWNGVAACPLFSATLLLCCHEFVGLK